MRERCQEQDLNVPCNDVRPAFDVGRKLKLVNTSAAALNVVSRDFLSGLYFT